MTALDYVAVGIDAIILIGVAIFTFIIFSDNKNCMLIEVDNDDLKRWRFNLYVGITSLFLTNFFTFVQSLSIRYLFHAIFTATMAYNLWSSLPAYICKYRQVLGQCKCDNYQYNDFPVLILLGVLGALTFAIFSWKLTPGIVLMVSLFIVMSLVYFFLPKKKTKPLEISNEVQLFSADDYQNFLMVEPEFQKLVILLSSTCKFCEMQIKEIKALPQELIINRIRVVDLTDKANVDKVLLFSLNLEEKTKFGLPQTLVINGGMCVDQIPGIVLSQDIMVLVS